MIRKRALVPIIILFASNAWANVPSSLQIYTTHGDFDVIYNTFLRIALLMSDPEYKSVYFSVVVASIVIGSAAVFLRSMTSDGGLQGILRVFGVAIIGAILYTTFIAPTNSITIYDETLNLSGTVGNVPEGLIFIAGLANKLEQGFVELIWTSAAAGVASYRDNPGGLIFNLMKNIYSGGVDLTSATGPGVYINTNLRRYIDDCLLEEIVRPGTNININDFNRTTDFLAILQEAQSLSRWTVWADDTYRAGATVTCTQSYTSMKNFFDALTPASPLVTRFYREKCGKAGLSQPAGATGTPVDVQCRDMVEAMTNRIIGGAIDASQIVKQYIIATQLWQSLKEGDVRDVADYQSGTSMMGMAEMANDWIPMIRGMVFSVFIGLFPFIAILLVTTKMGKALGFILGAFIFLVSWGVCDALIHSYAIEKSLAIMQEIASGGLGLRSVLMFEEKSAKCLAIFAASRWFAMSIAGILSALIGGFGGSALSSFASQLSDPKHTGGSTALTMGNPDQKAGKMSALEGAVPTQTVSNHFGFNDMGQAALYGKMERTSTALGNVHEFGGGDAMTAGERVATANTTHTASNVAGTETTGREGAKSISRTNAGISLAAQEQMEGQEQSIGHAEGLQRFLNSDTFNELYERVGKDRYTKSSLQDQLTRISGNEAVRNALARGDVDKIAHILGEANAIQTAENTGRAFGIGSVGEAYNGGAITGQKTKQDWNAYSNFVRRYGDDAYGMSLKQGYAQGYVSGLATEYYGQALSGHIDPELQKRVAQVNASEDGRQLWQSASSHTGRYASLTEDEAANLNKYAAQAGFKGFEAQAGDGVTVAWGTDTKGNLGVSSIHFDKSAGGRKGQAYTHDDGVFHYNKGLMVSQDALTNKIYEDARDDYRERGMSDEEAHNHAVDRTARTMGNFNAGKEFRSNFTAGGAIGAAFNVWDTFKGENTIFTFSLPDGPKTEIKDNFQNQNPIPLFFQNNYEDKGS